MESITRRSFAAGVAAAGLTTSAIATSAFASEAAATHTGGNVPDAWDLECEVLALGGGCAGMSAAYKAAELGAVIMPPVPAFYHRPQSLDDVINQTVNRVLDQFDIDLPEDLFTRWQGA